MLEIPRFIRSSEQKNKKKGNKRVGASKKELKYKISDKAKYESQTTANSVGDDYRQTLREILLTPLDPTENGNRVETYTMRGESDSDQSVSLIVTRMPLTFNNSDCQLINFTDITAYKRLE